MKPSTRRKKEKRFLELLKTAADQCADPIIISSAKVDPHQMKIVYANNAFCTMSGYSHKYVIGKTPLILQGPKSDQAVFSQMQKKILAGETFEGETICYTKNKTEFIIEWNATPVHNSIGKVTHIISIQRDISKRITENAVKDTRIEEVSKEFKSPLTSIKGFVEMLKKRWDDNPKDKPHEYLAVIEHEVERLIVLTNELLESGRVKKNSTLPTKNPCDLDKLISQVIKRMKVTTALYKIRRRGKVKMLVHCDKEHISQALTNILINAIQYSPDATEVFIWVKKDQHSVTISIQDFGIGIPADKQKALFDRLYHPRETIQTQKSGLGLPTAAEIVRNHGGTIWVDSIEGQGSTFSFNLPFV